MASALKQPSPRARNLALVATVLAVLTCTVLLRGLGAPDAPIEIAKPTVSRDAAGMQRADVRWARGLLELEQGGDPIFLVASGELLFGQGPGALRARLLLDGETVWREEFDLSEEAADRGGPESLGGSSKVERLLGPITIKQSGTHTLEITSVGSEPPPLMRLVVRVQPGRRRASWADVWRDLVSGKCWAT